MRYYVNTNVQANGDHEVHESTCSRLPIESNRQYLGDFTSCSPAVTKAKEYFKQSNGCYYCARACNTG